MRNGRLPLGAKDLDVQMREAAGYGEDDAQAADRVQRGELQVVVQRAHLVVVGDQPQLRAGVPGSHIRRDETWERGGEREEQQNEMTELLQDSPKKIINTT